jgi:hypothetical protein
MNPNGEGGASLKIVNILKHIELTDIVKKTFYDFSTDCVNGQK